ncbi:type VII secretion protein EccB [Mangrovihabitans endophyticus]|uniref:type VII secretion protein EccB n=1 Tax=Mangrovihabitans endophyticus TaxID=1751298 RepID=UPI00166C605A|nr:type VII secretion protein EccB [Mangrovihabitans endophyticus]
MPSRQDQLHSYQYSLQRVVAALVTHDPDPHRSPLRRAGMTVLVGAVIATLALGGTLVYGILTGTNTVELRDESVVFLEKGSGARFVYLKTDDRLHPIINYSSGLLIANSSEPKVVSTSSDRLATMSLGEPLGIPDAPDSLPDADHLLPDDWTVCSQRAGDSPIAEPRSLLLVGDRIAGGNTLAAPPPGGKPQALLVSDALDRIYLVFGNRRFLVPGSRVQQTRTWFGWTEQPLPVATGWLNAVPVGADLQAPRIPRHGAPSPTMPNHRVGQLLRVSSDPNGSPTWGVVMADGVADLTEVQALLMRAAPEGAEPEDMDRTRYGNLPRSATVLTAAASTAGFPATVPTLLDSARRVCVTSAENDSLTVRIDPAVPAGAPVRRADALPGGVQADLVHVPRGHGALVVSAASPTAPATAGTVSVVTDTGVRYPIASRNLLGKLGYHDAKPVEVPAQLVSLLPQGPSLDPERARRPVTASD